MDPPKPRLGILEFAQSVLGITPYPWQAKTLCHIQAGHPTALTACNGAGKTSTVLVAAALWALFNWAKARVVVTSASWSQLKKQFFQVIAQARFHSLFRAWTFNEAEVRTPAGGFIVGVSTDEAGRAEGYHSRPESPVMILADEAKSIGDDCFCLSGPLHGHLAGVRLQCWARLRHFLFVPHHIPELLGMRPGEKFGVPAYQQRID